MSGTAHTTASAWSPQYSMGPSAETVAHTLGKARRCGKGWSCLCPAHDDRNPSLTITDGENGKLLVNCKANCSQEEVIAALRARGLWPGLERRTNGNGAAKPKENDWHPIVPPPADAAPPAESLLRCDMLHEYYDAYDRLLFYVRRFEARGKAGKYFLPLTYGVLNGYRDWHERAPEQPRPLYRLNAFGHSILDPTIVLCEGEKAADAAARILPDMFVPMSWLGGAKAIHKSDFSVLKDADVLLWPDADDAGRAAMSRIAKLLPQARILDTARLPNGFDAADLEASLCDDPVAWLEARLLREEPELEPEPPTDEPKQEHRKPELRLRFGFDATHAEPMGTVVEGLLHGGSVTLIYGPPKSGKSFLATDAALAITSEQGSWMGHEIVRPGPVLYVACEGHAGFWKRLTAAAKTRGWDKDTFPPSFILATGRPVLIRADARGTTYTPDPSAILTALDEAKQHGMQPVAIVIDTVFRSFGVGNVNASPDMNVYLACVAVLTDAGYAVALVHHEIKTGGTPAGSVSLIGGTDNLIHVWRASETGTRRFWQVEAAKDEAETEPRAFTLEVVPLGLDADGRPASSCVVRDAGSAPGAATKKRGRPPSSNSETAVLAELIYTEVCNLLADRSEGQDVCIRPQSPPIRAVSRSRLRGAINQAGILDPVTNESDRKRVTEKNDTQVKRAINMLKNQQKIAADEHWIGLPQHGGQKF